MNKRAKNWNLNSRVKTPPQTLERERDLRVNAVQFKPIRGENECKDSDETSRYNSSPIPISEASSRSSSRGPDGRYTPTFIDKFHAKIDEATKDWEMHAKLKLSSINLLSHFVHQTHIIEAYVNGDITLPIFLRGVGIKL